MQTNYDFIVVGSGPSGGTVAYNLVKTGAKVLMLEAGKHYTKDTFPRTEAEGSAQLYWGGGIEFDHRAKMAFLRARCIGGTSIVNGGLLDRFDHLAFDPWKEISGVDFFSTEHMAIYYDKVEKKIALHTFDESELTPNSKLFIKGCEKSGFKWSWLRQGNSDCAYKEGNDCIGCLNGCHRDSKQSSWVAYIQEAVKMGLDIWSEFMVEKIIHKKDIVRVEGYVGKGKNKKKQILSAPKIVLAAGTFGTTQILLKSGFKAKLPTIGKNFSTHPQFMHVGVFDEIINSHKGALQCVTCKADFREDGFKLENVFAGPIAISMLFRQFGKKHQSIMQNYNRLSCVEVAIRDEATGTIDIDRKGKLVVKKDMTEQDKRRMKKGLNALNIVLANAGAKEVYEAPTYFGLHLMGGCQMGVNGRYAVVNPEFNLHDHKNIYIGDGSIFPNAPGINPSLTIFALSQKMSEEIIRNN